jgi:hypothetical protein
LCTPIIPWPIVCGWRQDLCRRKEAPSTLVTVSPEPVSMPALPAPPSAIEIEFASGMRVRITGAVDGGTLAAVITALVASERRR